MAQTYAQENGLFFMETSAKTAANVKEIFYEIGELSLHSENQDSNLFFLLLILKTVNAFLLLTGTARRLPRVQPTENPSGMVLPDRAMDRAASSSCCA